MVAQVLALPSAMLAADASGAVVAAVVPVAPSVVVEPAVRPQSSRRPEALASVRWERRSGRLQSMLQRQPVATGTSDMNIRNRHRQTQRGLT